MKTPVLLILFTVALSAIIHAQKSAVFVKDNIAINGYDAVAYFTEHKPVKGSDQFSFEWNNAKWLFSNKAHLDSFKINPLKYAPQFGGYCAFGMADGHKAPTDPDAWSIVNDKLYLNYNKAVQVMWQQKQDDYIKTAEKNWPALKDKE